jgi:hypothetical protein
MIANPGKGHFCMLARWVSAADPMTFAETSDITYNVRQNNNIVWRNLNIVDLGGDAMRYVSFIMRNNEDRPGMSLIIRPPADELNESFFRMVSCS